MTSNAHGAARILGSLRTADGESIVRIEDRFDTAIDDVWSALTDPDRLARWYGDVEGDLRLGGEYRARLHASGWEGTGRVEACEPPRRLLLVTEGPGEAGRGEIEVTLTGDGDQTVVVWEERGMPLKLIAAYGAGIQIHVEDLGDHVAGLERRDAEARWEELLPPLSRAGRRRHLAEDDDVGEQDEPDEQQRRRRPANGGRVERALEDAHDELVLLRLAEHAQSRAVLDAGGIRTFSTRLSVTEPEPLHSGHGRGMTRPSPPHSGQSSMCSQPPAPRAAESCRRPRPPQAEHPRTSLPGTAPEPRQSAHWSGAAKRTSRLVPRSASIESISTSARMRVAPPST